MVRRAKYRYRVTKAGYYEVNLRIDGRRRWFTGRTYADVELKVDEALALERQGVSSGKGSWRERSLSEWLDYWLETVVSRNRPSTYASYDTNVRLFVKPHPISRMKLGRVSADDIQEWRNWLAQAPSVRAAAARSTRDPGHYGRFAPKDLKELSRLAGQNAQSLGSATQFTIWRRLSAAFGVAVRRRHIDFNPMKAVDPPRYKAPTRPAPTPERARQLLVAIQSERFEAAVVLALAVGLRRGEVLGLHWQDVQWSYGERPGYGTVRIHRQLQRLSRGQGLALLDYAKTDQSEAVRPLNPFALAALRRRQQIQVDELLGPARDSRVLRPRWFGTDIRPGVSGLVFTTRRGTALDPRRFDMWVRRMFAKAGLPPSYTFHQLRHDFASILLTQGVAPRVSQEMMRHADYRTTAAIYQHVSEDQHFDAAEAVYEWLKRIAPPQ